jgi:hypothetical protein
MLSNFSNSLSLKTEADASTGMAALITFRPVMETPKEPDSAPVTFTHCISGRLAEDSESVSRSLTEAYRSCSRVCTATSPAMTVSLTRQKKERQHKKGYGHGQGG